MLLLNHSYGNAKVSYNGMISTDLVTIRLALPNTVNFGESITHDKDTVLQ